MFIKFNLKFHYVIIPRAKKHVKGLACLHRPLTSLHCPGQTKTKLSNNHQPGPSSYDILTSSAVLMPILGKRFTRKIRERRGHQKARRFKDWKYFNAQINKAFEGKRKKSKRLVKKIKKIYGRVCERSWNPRPERKSSMVYLMG